MGDTAALALPNLRVLVRTYEVVCEHVADDDATCEFDNEFVPTCEGDMLDDIESDGVNDGLPVSDGVRLEVTLLVRV